MGDAAELDLALLAQRTNDQPAEQGTGERALFATRRGPDQRSQDDRDHQHHVAFSLVIGAGGL